jgi:hypothetical protein
VGEQISELLGAVPDVLRADLEVGLAVGGILEGGIGAVELGGRDPAADRRAAADAARVDADDVEALRDLVRQDVGQELGVLGTPVRG